MEISLLKSLLSSITCFFQLSSSESMKIEPIQTYHEKIEEILRILKPILDGIADAEIISDEMLQRALEGILQSVDELKEICESWQPLMSKVYFVLQVEPLMSKIRNHGLEIVELLNSADQCLPVELSSASLEQYLQKIEHVEFEQTSSIIMGAIKDHVGGCGASEESLAEVGDCLGLKSNEELLIEVVALEKLKENAEQEDKSSEVDYIDQMIGLVIHMHELLVTAKQLETCNPVAIPPDFCCPLSLELMTDPVIVASGQTYERAFIRRWIDLGLTVCPKTRQTLAHTNLIPNYTVKALIANWCESNNVKLPDPKSTECGGVRRVNNCGTPDKSISSPLASIATRRDGSSPSHPRSLSADSFSEAAINGNGLDMERVSLRSSEDRLDHSGERTLNSGGSVLMSPSRNGGVSGNVELHQGHNRTDSVSSTHSNSNTSQGIAADGNEVASHASAYGSDASGELNTESQPAYNVSAPQRDTDAPSRLETRLRGQAIWLRPSERFVQRAVSSPTVQTRPDLLEVEIQVKRLAEDLRSSDIDVQRSATYDIRVLAKHDTENRTIIANCGAIPLLVNLLRSTDLAVQEHAVTALLNLSINDNNKTAIADAEAIEPLIYVLETGSPEARENSAATLFSLSVIEEIKIKIGRSGAIRPLVDLLGNGTPRGKKDAATALFNLSINHENKARIVQAGAVKYLVELMDPAFGMVDKAVAVLSNLATMTEGRAAIGQENGIPVLVEVVELGSARGKENAAAGLLQLCTNSARFCNMALLEGVVPPLVALSQSGTPRAREKAQQLLSFFRNQRHGNTGRG
ncbi:U-box domain-containing protein 4 [Salvia divinorum]|uniref:RING-type E3 ubiquitin transferase n=1 Tax=Salvia divinorum TaxID=28513 RepID=A0ABD1IC34_SALDI